MYTYSFLYQHGETLLDFYGVLSVIMRYFSKVISSHLFIYLVFSNSFNKVSHVLTKNVFI